ncbi:glycosyltransferase family 2 protein [Vibrio breoganii]|uniref:glycosyltransferase family 2 protein n=1 Tax=Vibrio breoganii TaxID=553239 RepID=UPI000C858E10|nr:glycosyltransferase family 2 protein [Vibrio breoganii]PML40466.1 hypothetical protein BCT77_07305 [Vibrio breoganii]PMO77620.1 hypothetical protein BCT02_07310 [Vibrio breoganii]PMO86531.1 hypothetical protein BCS99_11310 [Vibrio breoganii]
MIKVSIIVPTFNSSRYVTKLLETVPDCGCEVIIVDDYSEDLLDLRRIVEHYKNVRLISNSSLKGAGTCRNIGIENAHGEYLVFADSDDYFDNDATQVFADIEKYLPLNCDIAYFKPASTSLRGDISTRHETYVGLVDLHLKQRLDYLKYWFHVPWSKIFRREFVIKNSFKFSDTLVSNDVIFSLNTGINANSIISHDLSFYTVVERGGSLTRTTDFKKLLQRLTILREYNDILKKRGLQRYSIPEAIYLIRMFKLNPRKTLQVALTSHRFFPGRNYIISRILIRTRTRK